MDERKKFENEKKKCQLVHCYCKEIASVSFSCYLFMILDKRKKPNPAGLKPISPF